MEHVIKTAGAIEVNRGGAVVSLNMQKVGPDMIAQLLEHGIAAKVGDAAASASAIAGESHFGKAKKDVNKADWKAWQDSNAGQKAIAEIAQQAMEGVCEALYEGSWSQRGGGGAGRVRLPEDKALALKNAKADLLVAFKRITGKGKIADMVEHEKVAPYFNQTADAVTWNDEAAIAWMEKQAEAGKRDYLAEAQAALSVDLDDLDI
ncbi:MAG: hypothetical protein CL484_03065 [Acidobacteria bacterium]|nr:hypothetical protein [Acidobacteriota bacterium]|tara:strand:- start:469 stop:1086 length:618 start_codon:yes stop_codon:yes gene_type:complete